MAEENVSQKLRQKNIDETRNYLIKEINRNDLISKKYKKVCATLSYIEHFLILGSTVTGCISNSAFAFLVAISIRISSCSIGLKICTITAAIKKYKPPIKKEKNRPDRIVLLAKSKLNSTEA